MCGDDSVILDPCLAPESSFTFPPNTPNHSKRTVALLCCIVFGGIFPLFSLHLIYHCFQCFLLMSIFSIPKMLLPSSYTLYLFGWHTFWY